MADFLSYRIPGTSIIELRGSFLPVDQLEEMDGFVVSNFEGTKFFGFDPTATSKGDSIVESVNPYVIDENDYLNQANKFISAFESSSLQKAILSRIKKVSTDISPNELFHRLTIKYPNAFCYCIQSENFGTWVGATPEQLMKWENGNGETIALAGTKATTNFLAWGEKEQQEQQLVANYISEKIHLFSTEVKMEERKEFVAGPVKHLVTNFQFRCEAEKRFKLVKEMHPTPAVSGFPVREAIDLIHSTEQHQRDLYAGIIGVTSSNATNLFVNLRCCQFIGTDAYLYVGGGLTKDSIPENEWIETENKALTLLNVLQNK